MENTVYYDIKYPFTAEDTENFYLDANKTLLDCVRSQLMHIIFTPKGQKIRDPEFGTNLVKYLFEISDKETFNDVKQEVSETLSKYATNVTLNSINVLESEEDIHQIFVRIDYTVKYGNNEVKDTIITKL